MCEHNEFNHKENYDWVKWGVIAIAIIFASIAISQIFITKYKYDTKRAEIQLQIEQLKQKSKENKY